MVTTTLRIDLDVLGRTFATLDGLAVHSLDLRQCRTAETRAIVGFSGASAERLQSVLATDPTVSAPVTLVPGDERSLVRVVLESETALAGAHAFLVEQDGVLQDASAVDGRWEFDLFFPDRASLSEFYDRCKEDLTGVECRSVSVGADLPAERTYGTTKPQRDTLRAAVESGYFSVPKESSLVEVADGLDLSDQAVSERLRRGTETLVEHTLFDDDPDRSPSPP